MATTDDKLVTAKGLAQSLGEVAVGGGVQFVELFHGDSSTVTLPQSFDTYKVLFVCARTNDGYGSGCCVPPCPEARFYDGKRNQRVGFSGNTASAPYLYTITDIYAIA